MPTERIYIDKDKIIAKNSSGIETFNTNWSFIKSSTTGNLKGAGYNQVPVFVLNEKTYFNYNGAGSGSYSSLGIVEIVDNSYRGGQLAFFQQMGPTVSQQWLVGGVKWGTSFEFYLPKNDTGYSLFSIKDVISTVIPYVNDVFPPWIRGDYFNRYTSSNIISSTSSTFLGTSPLLNIVSNGNLIGKYRWYAIQGHGAGTGDWDVYTYPGPPILEPNMLDYWKQGGFITLNGTTNRTCTNGYVVPADDRTGCLLESTLTIITGFKSPETFGLSYTL